MDALLIDTSDNPQQIPTRDLSTQTERNASSASKTLGNAETELSLEQAVSLFQSVEIPVLVAQRVHHRSDFRKLILQYPCHLRGPGEDGLGIAVTNRIDAIAACQTLMSRKVNGIFPEYLLIEGDYSSERQLSLSMDLDERSGEVTLCASDVQRPGGSLPLEANGIAQTVQPVGFSPEDGLAFANRLGLDGQERDGLARLLEKLYILMTWAGLTHCRLESLVIGQIGEAIALRGQLRFGQSSPLRHQAEAARQAGIALHPTRLTHGSLTATESPKGNEGKTHCEPSFGEATGQTQRAEAVCCPEDGSEQLNSGFFLPPRVVRLGEGNIAVVSNGFSRTMATVEQFQQRGGSVAAFVSLLDGGGTELQTPKPEHLSGDAGQDEALLLGSQQGEIESSPKQVSNFAQEETQGLDAFSQKRQLCQALQALARLPRIKVILINWRCTRFPCRILADALVEYQRQLSRQGRRSASSLSLVVRLVGEGAEAGSQRLRGEEIEVEESLEGAIACSLGLARMGRG